jgi:hypothetical protein
LDPDRLDYSSIVQDALRGAVRMVLAQVAEHGVPGDHHFFIAFKTGHPGVVVPRFLRDRYPDETKIVLQHQFWDLEVDAEMFSVTLTFNGQRQRLTVPFSALTVFVDPAAEFMLRFDGSSQPDDDEDDQRADIEPMPSEGPRLVPPKPGEVLRFDPTRRK